LEARLLSINTALACLQGKGASLEVDLSEFYAQLYPVLREMLHAEEHVHMPLLLNCLHLLLVPPLFIRFVANLSFAIPFELY
jgi:hypothetical protein